MAGGKNRCGITAIQHVPGTTRACHEFVCIQVATAGKICGCLAMATVGAFSDICFGSGEEIRFDVAGSAWYTQDFPFCTLPKGISLPSPDTEVTLPFAKLTPLVALNAICPSNARDARLVDRRGIVISLPPADSGVSGRLPPLDRKVTAPGVWYLPG